MIQGSRMRTVKKKMLKELKSPLQGDPQPHTENAQSQKPWNLRLFSNFPNLQVLSCQGRGPIPCSLANFESSVCLRVPKCWNVVLRWVWINYARKKKCWSLKVSWWNIRGIKLCEQHQMDKAPPTGCLRSIRNSKLWFIQYMANKQNKKERAIFNQKCVVFSWCFRGETGSI